MNIRNEIINGINYLVDDNGNRASIEYWGSEDAARESLLSLTECTDCLNCSHCSDCSGCSDCSDCLNCSGCFDCYRCSDCSGCYGCYRCADCFGCSRCFDLKNASPEGSEPCSLIANAPKIENIHQAVYEAASAPGALNMRHWHSCETTHCRAGWVVHLAGEAGYALEKRTSTLFAAMQIYRASGYEISPCRFFDSSEDALEDMRKLAEEEAAINSMRRG